MFLPLQQTRSLYEISGLVLFQGRFRNKNIAEEIV